MPPPRLEGRDLGEVEDVADVEPVPGDLDAREAVDREVAERVCGGCGRRERALPRPRRGRRAASSRASLLATGAHRIEKCGLSASARPNQSCAAAAVAEAALDHAAVEELQRVASCRAGARASSSGAPRCSGRCARAPRPRTSSPSIDGRSGCALRASARRGPGGCRGRRRRARSRGRSATPFATSSRSITPISAYCLRAQPARARSTRTTSPRNDDVLRQRDRFDGLPLERDRGAQVPERRLDRASPSSANG